MPCFSTLLRLNGFLWDAICPITPAILSGYCDLPGSAYSGLSSNVGHIKWQETEHNFEFPQLSFCLFKEKISSFFFSWITGIVSLNQTPKNSTRTGTDEGVRGRNPIRVPSRRVTGDTGTNERKTWGSIHVPVVSAPVGAGIMCCLLSKGTQTTQKVFKDL